MAQKSNENQLGLYQIGYTVGANSWNTFIIAYGPENAVNFIQKYVGQPIKVSERGYLGPVHHLTGRARKTFLKAVAVESPELLEQYLPKKEEEEEVWRCPYCNWTGKTNTALKAHITRQHKEE